MEESRSDFLQVAMEAAYQGYPVFPIRPLKKNRSIAVGLRVPPGRQSKYNYGRHPTPTLTWESLPGLFLALA